MVLHLLTKMGPHARAVFGSCNSVELGTRRSTLRGTRVRRTLGRIYTFVGKLFAYFPVVSPSWAPRQGRITSNSMGARYDSTNDYG